MLDWPAIKARLQATFAPEGDGQLFGDMAAKAVFTMLYVGAVDGSNPIRPTMVLWMGDAAAARAGDSRARSDWYEAARRGARQMDALHDVWDVPRDRWYGENSREPLRDEVFRKLLERGAMVRDQSRATTSPVPTWSLHADFAPLFDADLTGRPLLNRIAAWQRDHLTAVGLARIDYQQRSTATEQVVVTTPDGTTRRLAAGPSSHILKGVIEQALPRLAREPAVLFISESANKVDIVDSQLLERLGLQVEAGTLLPDALLFDAHEGVVWFVEAVASDGAITQARRQAMVDWAAAQPRPVPADRCGFLTAFLSRDARPFKKLVGSLAWNSYVWFLLEPDKVMHLSELR